MGKDLFPRVDEYRILHDFNYMSVETYKKQIIDLRARLDREKEAKKKDNEYHDR